MAFGTFSSLASSGAGYDDQNENAYRNQERRPAETKGDGHRGTRFECNLQVFQMQEGMSIKSFYGIIWAWRGRGELRSSAGRRTAEMPFSFLFSSRLATPSNRG